MNIIYWLSQRRKAIVTFIVGGLNVYLLYLTLVADGAISNADNQALVIAVVAWLGGTVFVHQATNITSE